MSETTDRARALLAAATPGPFSVYPLTRAGRGFGVGRETQSGHDEGICEDPHMLAGDAALFAAAPTIIATLCDEADAAGRRAVEAEAGAAAMRYALESITHTLRTDRDAHGYVCHQSGDFDDGLCKCWSADVLDECGVSSALDSVAGRDILDRLERAEAERDTNRAAAENAYAAQLAAESERDILRVVVSECAAAIGNGSGCSRDASVGFMATVPTEIRAEMDVLRAENGAANARADRLYQDRYDLLGIKTTEGLSASEWMMRTATAERERDALRAELEKKSSLRAKLSAKVRRLERRHAAL